MKTIIFFYRNEETNCAGTGGKCTQPHVGPVGKYVTPKMNERKDERRINNN